MIFLSPCIKLNLSCGISSIVRIEDLSPASIFKMPSPYENSSSPDEPVTLKTTSIFLDANFR